MHSGMRLIERATRTVSIFTLKDENDSYLCYIAPFDAERFAT